MKRNLLRSLWAFLMIVALVFTMVESPAIAQSTSSNLVLNGGFEQQFNYWSDSGAVKVVTDSPHSGRYVASFNYGSYQNKNGRLSQKVQTVPGTRYDLKLYTFENGDNGAASSKVNVLVNGGSLLNKTVEASGRNWTLHTFNFTANSNQTTLLFTDLSTGDLTNTDINLDDISIVVSATQPKKTLKYGESYKLMNQSSGDYLDVDGKADYCQTTTKFEVVTDKEKEKATFWKFESATGASEGTPVSIGDLVYLQEPDINSYLDICGLTSCQGDSEFPAVTDTEPDRAGVGTGTWKLESTTGAPEGTPLSTGDLVYLQNQWSALESYLQPDECDLDNSTPTKVVTTLGNPGEAQIWKILD